MPGAAPKARGVSAAWSVHRVGHKAVCHSVPGSRAAPGEAAGDAVPALAAHLWRFRGRLLFLISSDLMCSARRSSCLMHQCRRMLVVNWSSGWQGRLSTIFTISSLGLRQTGKGT